MKKDTHGLFISYKRSHKHLAGRIYDFFMHKGLKPFMDEHSIDYSRDFREDIKQKIIDTPYFILLLTRDGLENLIADDRNESVYYNEVKTALDSKTDIRVILYDDVKPRDLAVLPKEIENLQYIHNYALQDSNLFFYELMEKIHGTLDIGKMLSLIDWADYTSFNSNTLISPRISLETTTASWENRFGKEFIECVKEGKDFNGTQRVKEINMLCYAASLVFAPSKNMIDRFAYDAGLMFKIFSYLLKDEEFDLRIITTVPDSHAAKDAAKFAKLGNSALEGIEEAVFYGSYAAIASF